MWAMLTDSKPMPVQKTPQRRTPQSTSPGPTQQQSTPLRQHSSNPTPQSSNPETPDPSTPTPQRGKKEHAGARTFAINVMYAACLDPLIDHEARQEGGPGSRSNLFLKPDIPTHFKQVILLKH
uniref:Uncharacterized protein n=1 Tax=Dunaliella tertiolecta TaxID=3047 RepID=A0A7S3R6B9_DUNTE|mmetsp:Transcript_9419/g.25414  ORF Transcript_9419/g.25414 Transcript_9419/m.25414 type:complete len:123 (+) Transcript_9419:220-588(+)